MRRGKKKGPREGPLKIRKPTPKTGGPHRSRRPKLLKEAELEDAEASRNGSPDVESDPDDSREPKD